MPLTEAVSYKTVLQKGNRVQVPKLVRRQYKLEASEVLKVTAKVDYGYFSESESFYARMGASPSRGWRWICCGNALMRTKA